MNFKTNLKAEFAKVETRNSIKFIVVFLLVATPLITLDTEYYAPLVAESYKEHADIIKTDIILGLGYVLLHVVPMLVILYLAIGITEATAKKFGWLKYGKFKVKRTTTYQHGNCSLEFSTLAELNTHIKVCDGSHDRRGNSN